jgi:predicted dehydrogenase
MKIALLGTGFGHAHAAVYAQRPDVDEVVVFGRTPDKLATISGQFGFATTTDLDGLIADLSVDLVDIACPPGCTPTSPCGPCKPASTCLSSCR